MCIVAHKQYPGIKNIVRNLFFVLSYTEMFAAVEYKSNHRKRQFDVLETEKISNFCDDYHRKKFKMESPEGEIYDGIVIETGPNRDDLLNMLNTKRPRTTPISLCRTASNLENVFPKNSKMKSTAAIDVKKGVRMNRKPLSKVSNNVFTLTAKSSESLIKNIQKTDGQKNFAKVKLENRQKPNKLLDKKKIIQSNSLSLNSNKSTFNAESSNVPLPQNKIQKTRTESLLYVNKEFPDLNLCNMKSMMHAQKDKSCREVSSTRPQKEKKKENVKNIQKSNPSKSLLNITRKVVTLKSNTASSTNITNNSENSSLENSSFIDNLSVNIPAEELTDNRIKLSSRNVKTSEDEKMSELKETITKLKTQIQKLRTEKEKLIDQMEQLKVDKKQLKIQLDDKCALVDDLTKSSLTVQKEVINKFDALTDLVRDLLDSNPNYSSPDGAHNTVGYIDKRRQMAHVGRGQWIREHDWYYCWGLSDVNAFIRELARRLIGTDVLKTSTRTGRVSNRSINNNSEKNFEKIDPQKIIAIQDAVRVFLSNNQKFRDLDFDVIEMTVKDTPVAIGQYAAELKKQKIQNLKELKRKELNVKNASTTADEEEQKEVQEEEIEDDEKKEEEASEEEEGEEASEEEEKEEEEEDDAATKVDANNKGSDGTLEQENNENIVSSGKIEESEEQLKEKFEEQEVENDTDLTDNDDDDVPKKFIDTEETEFQHEDKLGDNAEQQIKFTQEESDESGEK